MNIKGSSAEKRSPEKSCWGDIRELISKHLNRQDSRYILGGRKAAKGWDYHYSLEDLPSIDEVVLAVKNGTLIIPDGIEKLRFEIGSFLEKSEEPCFVKLRETETDYQLHFQGISGY